MRGKFTNKEWSIVAIVFIAITAGIDYWSFYNLLFELRAVGTALQVTPAFLAMITNVVPFFLSIVFFSLLGMSEENLKLATPQKDVSKMLSKMKLISRVVLFFGVIIVGGVLVLATYLRFSIPADPAVTKTHIYWIQIAIPWITTIFSLIVSAFFFSGDIWFKPLNKIMNFGTSTGRAQVLLANEKEAQLASTHMQKQMYKRRELLKEKLVNSEKEGERLKKHYNRLANYVIDAEKEVRKKEREMKLPFEKFNRLQADYDKKKSDRIQKMRALWVALGHEEDAPIADMDKFVQDCYKKIASRTKASAIKDFEPVLQSLCIGVESHVKSYKSKLMHSLPNADESKKRAIAMVDLAAIVKSYNIVDKFYFQNMVKTWKEIYESSES